MARAACYQTLDVKLLRGSGLSRGRTGEKRITYPRLELALRYGAGVETETSMPREAYAPFPKWQPGPPETWDGLPWAQ